MIKKIKENKHKSKSGCACLFIPISRTEGVKLFSTKKERNFAFNRQKKAATLGLAPKARHSFDLKKAILNKKYGYITQRASLNHRKCDDWRSVIALQKRLDKNGFASGDIFIGHNVGVINNKLVCIDFDKNTQACIV